MGRRDRTPRKAPEPTLDQVAEAAASVEYGKRSVVQLWVVENCSWKEQTVLFTALRGPDFNGSPEVKLIIRWMRSAVLKNAAPKKRFMKEVDFRRIAELDEENPRLFGMMTLHWFTHIMHAMEIIAYRCTNEDIRVVAEQAYEDLVRTCHLNPERNDQLTARLKDEV